VQDRSHIVEQAPLLRPSIIVAIVASTTPIVAGIAMVARPSSSVRRPPLFISHLSSFIPHQACYNSEPKDTPAQRSCVRTMMWL
jgi:hypothetical protein